MFNANSAEFQLLQFSCLSFWPFHFLAFDLRLLIPLLGYLLQTFLAYIKLFRLKISFCIDCHKEKGEMMEMVATFRFAMVYQRHTLLMI